MNKIAYAAVVLAAGLRACLTPPGSSSPPISSPSSTDYVKGSGYARALQLGFYFFEAQQSGALSARKVRFLRAGTSTEHSK